MAISRKNRSRVSIDGKEYLWWVFDEHDQTEFDGVQVKVVSSDQTHFLKYGLQQPEHNRKVVLSLRDYAKLVHLSSPPKFENEDGIITKSGICRLIEWCKGDDHKIEYAVDGGDNKLTNEHQVALLNQLKERMK